MRRVVVTGMGIVSSIGNNAQEVLASLREAKATGHDRIALEMAGEEPKVRLELEHGADQALAVLAAGLRDLGDAVEHEHGGQRQLGIAGAEEFPPRAGQ